MYVYKHVIYIYASRTSSNCQWKTRPANPRPLEQPARADTSFGRWSPGDRMKNFELFRGDVRFYQGISSNLKVLTSLEVRTLIDVWTSITFLFWESSFQTAAQRLGNPHWHAAIGRCRQPTGKVLHRSDGFSMGCGELQFILIFSTCLD